MSSLKQDLAAYEQWLRKRCDVVEADLQAKHERMRRSAFDFLRATYFRWARAIESACPELGDAPRLACVGDIHLENFGTWRDADARLVWGVNDFDEAAVMPYALDLVRLTTSVRLAPGHALDAKAICAAILAGYREGLARPRSVLLDEHAHWLRPFADAGPGANKSFWRDIDACPDASPPSEVRRALKQSLPEGAEVLRFASRRKGGGSLGRPRFVVVAHWNSGRVVREAKALVPSAWNWAHARKGQRSRFIELAYGKYRSPDPELRAVPGYVVRRIAPDSRKVDIDDVERQGLGSRLVSAMGADLGAIHAADARSSAVAADLDARPAAWLYSAATAAAQMTQRDFESW